jgi:flagellar assembly protein FliH
VNAKSNWRPHRFAPLSQLTDTDAWQSGVPIHLSARMQTWMAEGFQRGVDRGYSEGHQSGMRSGIDEGVVQGRNQGLREGAEEGQRSALNRFEGLAAPLDAMLQALQRIQSDYQAALRKEVVELVAKVAREVIRCELDMKPEQLLKLVDETLASMPRTPRRTVEVYLNPQDLERIRELDGKVAARWNLVAHDALEPGECRIKAGNHEADAGCRQRLAACMEQISTQLLPQGDGPQAPA